MRFVRTVTHALVLWGVIVIAAQLLRVAGRPGFDAVMPWIGFGTFFVFAASTAAAINFDRPALLILVGFLLLWIWPPTAAEVARALAPVGLGVIAGTLARAALLEEDGEWFNRRTR
jgi:hypothetical protein